MIVLALAARAAADTLRVPDDFASLQDALDAAGDGDRIEVGAGTWLGPVFIGADVEIVATEGRDLTELAADGSGEPTMRLGGAQASIAGFTMRCDTGSSVLEQLGGALVIEDARITDCVGSGALAVSDGTLTVRDAWFDASHGELGAAIAADQSDVTLEDVVFEQISASGEVVVAVNGHGSLDASDVMFAGVTAGSLIATAGGEDVAWTRLQASCNSTSEPMFGLEAEVIDLGPTLVWGNGFDGAVLALDGAVTVRHATLVGDGNGVLVELAGGSIDVASSTFVDGDVAITGAAGVEADGDYNLFHAIAPGSGGVATADVEGSASLEADPLFAVWNSEAPCSSVLAPGVGSPLVDAGDPEVEDADGTRSDIGATGGPDGFDLGSDIDGDGWLSALDCDDADELAYPGATEVPYDGVDQDCDGADLDDVDGDGSAYGEDCDDGNAAAYPGATEIWYDGVDQDCAGGDDFDADGDGYVSADWGGEDCDDSNAGVNPGMVEDADDATDVDCDGLGSPPEEFGEFHLRGCASAPSAGGGLWLWMWLVWRPRRRGE